ncbi:MAG: FHA domain-containing protein, partial [Myxococcaceae bacterium]
MFLITLAEKGGGSEKLQIEKNEVTIGRLDGNDIVLAKGNVSKYHSKIVLKDGKFIVVDMKSTNGTYVNGKKIAAPQVIRPSDKIYIGDYILNVEPLQEMVTRAAPPIEEGYDDEPDYDDEEGYEEGDDEQDYDDPEPEPDLELTRGPAPSADRSRMPASMAAALARNKRKADPRIEMMTRLQKDIHDRLIEYLDLRRLDMDRLGDEELWRRTEKAIRDILDQMDADGEIPDDVDREELLTDVLNEALG